MSKLEKHPWLKEHVKRHLAKDQAKQLVSALDFFKKMSAVVPDWEIDANLLAFESKIASGSNSDLYKGIFCGRGVAVKVIRPEYQNKNIHEEFAQEVNIMRNLQHDNIVKFIGACTKPPNLCIVTEYVSGGSLYDFLRKQKGGLDLSRLLGIAVQVTKGMSYLHQNNIIHRDLKAANILLEVNGVVKVADFGVARVQTSPGVMTAETGTYRWMAPEVIEHRPIVNSDGEVVGISFYAADCTPFLPSNVVLKWLGHYKKNLIRLVDVATQKFVAEVASDALQLKFLKNSGHVSYRTIWRKERSVSNRHQSWGRYTIM